LPPVEGEDVAPVIGATDPDLLVDRISSDVQAQLGLGPGDVIGQSVLRLVHPESVAGLLWALAEATTANTGVTVPVRATRHHGDALLCQLLVIPLLPPPSFAFALLPGEHRPASAVSVDDMERALSRLGRGVEAIRVSRDLAGYAGKHIPGFSRLSSREIEIVGMLLAGDRVPAIAETLFITQSTVRNHLSSVFRKLRVNSQQELVTLLRDADTSSTDT